ncbi:unnamed protein product [Polarella glacialis]|nr:unnamed protein product [Polarella glacialis]
MTRPADSQGGTGSSRGPRSRAWSRVALFVVLPAALLWTGHHSPSRRTDLAIVLKSIHKLLPRDVREGRDRRQGDRRPVQQTDFEGNPIKNKDGDRSNKGGSSEAEGARLNFLLRRVKDKKVKEAELKECVGELRFRKLLRGPKEYTSVVTALARAGKHSSVLDLLNDMERSSLGPNVITYSAAISACTEYKHWEAGLHLLRRLQSGQESPNVITYNAAITSLEKSFKWEMALEVFSELLKSNLNPTEVSFSAAVSACRHGHNWELALHLNKDMLYRGLRGNLVTWSCLILALEKSNQPALALQTFGEMKQQGFQADESVFDALLRACAKGGLHKRAIFFLNKMVQAGLTPSAAGYSAAISACAADRVAAGGRAIMLFEEMQGKRLQPNPSAYAGVMAVQLAEGRNDLVRNLFEGMQAEGLRPTYAAYTIAMRALGVDKNGSQSVARRQLTLFDEMLSAGLSPPDASCFDIAACAHAHCGRGREAVALIKEVLSLGLTPSGAACESAIKASTSSDDASISGRDLEKLFSAGIAAYARAKNAAKAGQLLRRMRKSGFEPTEEAYSMVMAANQAKGNANETLQLFEEMQSASLEPGVEALSSVIRAHSSQGRWEQALEVFADLRASAKASGTKPAALEPAILAALDACQVGPGSQPAVKLLDQMRCDSLRPSVAVFEAAIAACAASGSWKPASNLCREMKSAGLQPSEAAVEASRPSGRLGAVETQSPIEMVEEMEGQRVVPDQELYREAVQLAKELGDRDLMRSLRRKLRGSVVGEVDLEPYTKKKSKSKRDRPDDDWRPSLLPPRDDNDRRPSTSSQQPPRDGRGDLPGSKMQDDSRPSSRLGAGGKPTAIDRLEAMEAQRVVPDQELYKEAIQLAKQLGDRDLMRTLSRKLRGSVVGETEMEEMEEAYASSKKKKSKSKRDRASPVTGDLPGSKMQDDEDDDFRSSKNGEWVPPVSYF